MTTNPTTRSVTVTMWADLGCPWATLALDTLHGEARRLGVDLLVDHRVFPLELFNRVPTPRQVVDGEIVGIAGRVPDLGWRMWRGPADTYPVTMLPAMEAVQAAKDPEIGGLAGSDQLDTALRRAFFVESRCVSMPSVILAVAERCPLVSVGRLASAIESGAGRAEVYRDWREARETSVPGSATLFGGDGVAVQNPGATVHWSKPVDAEDGGFPLLESYHRDWVAKLLGAAE